MVMPPRRHRRPPRRRPQEPGHTTRSGLDGKHKAARRAALKALTARPGQPCPRPYCGGAPMYATPQAAEAAGLPPWLWHVDLDDWPGRRFGGPQVKKLAHRHCNRKAGQAVTAAKLRARSPAAQTYTRW